MTVGVARPRHDWRGWLLLGSLIACAAASFLVPAMPQPLSYHAFADCRAFASIPTRHDIWRRVSCDWLAGLVTEGLLDADDAADMALDCATRLALRAYKLT